MIYFDITEKLDKEKIQKQAPAKLVDRTKTWWKKINVGSDVIVVDDSEIELDVFFRFYLLYKMRGIAAVTSALLPIIDDWINDKKIDVYVEYEQLVRTWVACAEYDDLIGGDSSECLTVLQIVGDRIDRYYE